MIRCDAGNFGYRIAVEFEALPLAALSTDRETRRRAPRRRGARSRFELRATPEDTECTEEEGPRRRRVSVEKRLRECAVSRLGGGLVATGLAVEAATPR